MSLGLSMEEPLQEQSGGWIADCFLPVAPGERLLEIQSSPEQIEAANSVVAVGLPGPGGSGWRGAHGGGGLQILPLPQGLERKWKGSQPGPGWAQPTFDLGPESLMGSGGRRAVRSALGRPQKEDLPRRGWRSWPEAGCPGALRPTCLLGRTTRVRPDVDTAVPPHHTWLWVVCLSSAFLVQASGSPPPG